MSNLQMGYEQRSNCNKKRRYDSDEASIDDTSISDYLSKRIELYKMIQLGVFLETSPSVDYIQYSHNQEEFLFNILNHFRNIIRKFFTDITFSGVDGSNTVKGYTFSKPSEYFGTKAYTLESWIHLSSIDDDKLFNLLEIILDSFNEYFEKVSMFLMSKFNVHISIEMNPEYDYAFCITVM